MTTYVIRNGELVDKSLAPPVYAADGAAYVISDEMPATRHMATNEMFTSKAKFRQATRAANCIEIGNETATLLKPRKPIQLSREQRVQEIKRVIQELKNRL